MSPEILVLILAGLLQVLQYVVFSITANLQVGLGYSTSPRDKERPLTGVAGRLQRALANHFEGLTLFTIAVVAVTLSGSASGFTAGCAWAYLAARVLYLPAYALGWTPWRSVIWAVGFLATLAMLLAALF
ncbi:MAPEG family protein [Pararhodobacter sp. SW119]|uniref:MAPEG family protein n=1 Tax=Pararhodobacter sp. SW119 TaxID=2780075 RepID=UPI001ADF4F44|nr:MAPEG family protein [Pararhodobacter sp. SW119]